MSIKDASAPCSANATRAAATRRSLFSRASARMRCCRTAWAPVIGNLPLRHPAGLLRGAALANRAPSPYRSLRITGQAAHLCPGGSGRGQQHLARLIDRRSAMTERKAADEDVRKAAMLRPGTDD